MHYLLFYDLSPDYLERRAEFRAEHLGLAWEAQGLEPTSFGGVAQIKYTDNDA